MIPEEAAAARVDAETFCNVEAEVAVGDVVVIVVVEDAVQLENQEMAEDALEGDRKGEGRLFES